jgi:hypothetical protein
VGGGGSDETDEEDMLLEAWGYGYPPEYNWSNACWCRLEEE